MQEWVILILVGAVAVCFIMFLRPETEGIKEAMPQLPMEIKAELKIPEIKFPDIKFPEIKFPEIPELKIPEWPKLNIPEIIDKITEPFTNAVDKVIEIIPTPEELADTTKEFWEEVRPHPVERIAKSITNAVESAGEKVKEAVEQSVETLKKRKLEEEAIKSLWP